MWGLPWSPTDIGAASLLAVVVVLILTGRLVPLRFYRDATRSNERLSAAHDRLAAAVERLGDGQHTQVRVLESLPTPATDSSTEESRDGRA